MALDDVIKQSSRGSGGVVRGGRPPRRSSARSSAPYQRSKAPLGEAVGTMSGASVSELAASDNPKLKVSGESKPNSVAGAICNIVREGQKLPSLLATGPAALNQACKAMAIARKYLHEEPDDKGGPVEIVIKPTFEGDIRQSSNVSYELHRAAEIIEREPSEDDLSAKDKTDCFKLAGAIAGRVREGTPVACTTKGAVPVLVAIKAIALAQDYVQEEGIDLKFAVQFRDLENTDRGMDNIPSTFLHFAILPRQ